VAERAAQMSTLTTVDRMAAIESFLTIVPEELAKGNIVELGEFGSFWLRVTSEGVEKPESVRADQIRNVLPRCMPGKLFKRVIDSITFHRNGVPAALARGAKARRPHSMAVSVYCLCTGDRYVHTCLERCSVSL